MLPENVDKRLQPRLEPWHWSCSKTISFRDSALCGIHNKPSPTRRKATKPSDLPRTDER
jgi:hypothetical protein